MEVLGCRRHASLGVGKRDQSYIEHVATVRKIPMCPKNGVFVLQLDSHASCIQYRGAEDVDG